MKTAKLFNKLFDEMATLSTYFQTMKDGPADARQEATESIQRAYFSWYSAYGEEDKIPAQLTFMATLYTIQVFAEIDPLDNSVNSGPGRYTYKETIALNIARKVITKLCTPVGSAPLMPSSVWKGMMKEFGNKKAFQDSKK